MLPHLYLESTCKCQCLITPVLAFVLAYDLRGLDRFRTRQLRLKNKEGKQRGECGGLTVLVRKSFLIAEYRRELEADTTVRLSMVASHSHAGAPCPSEHTQELRRTLLSWGLKESLKSNRLMESKKDRLLAIGDVIDSAADPSCHPKPLHCPRKRSWMSEYVTSIEIFKYW